VVLSVDLQEEHRRDERYLVEGFERVLANVMQLQQAARVAGATLVHSAYVVDAAAGPPRPFHPVLADGRSAFSDKDSPNTAICPEVAPVEGEILLVKNDASAFCHGDLDRLIAELGKQWLIVAGVWTEACIAATVRDAVAQGIRVLLVKDACGSGTAAMHETGILNLANRLYGGAVAGTSGACRLLAGEEVPIWMVEGAVPIRFGYRDAAALYAAL
jgi:nicotinamidase-related amidase